MLKLLIMLLLLSMVLVSGCVQKETGAGQNETATGQVTENLENQADEMINQELDAATENITLDDIESAIPE